MCTSNSLVALIHKDNTMQPAAANRLCTPFLLVVLFTGSDYQRWSESIFNTCPCFHKMYYTSCFKTHWTFTQRPLFRLVNIKKSNLHAKHFHEYYVFHSLRHFGHLSYIIIETCRNKTHKIFLDIMTKFTSIYFFGHFKQNLGYEWKINLLSDKHFTHRSNF